MAAALSFRAASSTSSAAAWVSRGRAEATSQAGSSLSPFITSFATATSTGPLPTLSAFSARRKACGPAAASLTVAAKRVIGR